MIRSSSGRSKQGGFAAHEQRAIDLVMKLMAIEGRSGQEKRVSDFVVKRLIRAGADRSAITMDDAHRRTPIDGETGNLFFKLKGTGRAPRRMFSAHLDTVPICIGSQPVRHERMISSADPTTGLGADDRAGVAVLLSVALEILEKQLPHPPLTFCWFVQEEVGLQGARCVSKRHLGRPRLAFNWDGGMPSKLTIGATGGYRMQIDVQGVASHAGGAPEWGVSAIAIAAIAIADLHDRGWHGAIAKRGKHGTSNVGMIRGGDATNVVTDRLTVLAEARSHDPDFRQRIVTEIERAFQRAARQVKNVAGARGGVQFDGRLDYESFLLPADDPSVAAATQAVRSLGLDPELAVANGGVDANWTTRHGIPTVTLGCGQVNQHTVSERLDVDRFLDACRIARCLATASENQ